MALAVILVLAVSQATVVILALAGILVYQAIPGSPAQVAIQV